MPWKHDKSHIAMLRKGIYHNFMTVSKGRGSIIPVNAANMGKYF